MMGDGGLAQIEGFGEVAHAGFAAVACLDDREQPQPVRVGEGLEDPCRFVRFGGIEDRESARLAAELILAGLDRCCSVQVSIMRID